MKLFHISDSHLRDLQYSRKARSVDFLHGFLAAIDKAAELQVDYVVHTGDIFNSKRPSSNMFDQLREINRRLISHGLQMITISGNHDKTKPAWFKQVDNTDSTVGIKCIDNSEFTIHSPDNTLQLTFKNPAATTAEQLRVWFASEDSTCDVVLWHGMVKEFCGFPVDGTFELAEFPVNKYRAIMLGDIHVTQTELLADGTPVSYPGSTELCELGEPFEKFGLLYEFGQSRFPIITAVPFETRPVFRLSVTKEEQLIPVLEELKKLAASGVKPIVGYYYSAKVGEVLKKAREVFGADDGILRPVPIVEDAPLDAPAVTSEQVKLTLTDLIAEFFFASTDPVYELAVALTNPGIVDVETEASAFIDAKLGV